MSRRVIIMHFEVESQAYQGFSEIKRLYAEKQIKGEQMAVVTHIDHGNHQFKIEDFIDFTGNNNTSKDSLIGMLIGILGGPLGILLGWFAGSLYGASKDAKEIKGAQTVFEHVTQRIGSGETGLILIAEEDDNRPLNHLIMNQLGGEITRLDFEDVEQELKTAAEVEQETKDSAHQSWNKKKKENETE